MNNRFQKGHPVPISYPVTSLEPLKAEGTTIVSPRIGNPHGLPEPSHYGEPAFFAELQEAMEVRQMVIRGEWPRDFLIRNHPEPDRFDGKLTPPLVAEGLRVTNPAGCANVVHMDAPTDMPYAVLSWLNRIGAPLKNATQFTDFLEAVPSVQKELARVAYENLEKAFEAKYDIGRERPEGAIDRIYGGDDVTFDCRSYTAYEEGCPNHPAYPAGHGSASATVKELDNHFYLDNATQDVIFDTAYLWSMFRTFALVHFASDNLAGLMIGGMMGHDAQSNKWLRVW